MKNEDKKLAMDFFDLVAGAPTLGLIKPSFLVSVYHRIFSKYSIKDLSKEELYSKYSNEKNLFEIVYEGRNIKLPQVVLFENTFHLEDVVTKLILDTNSPEYKIPDAIHSKSSDLISLQKKRLKKSYYNSTTIRLNGYYIKPGVLELLVSKSTYENYIGTNYSMNIQLKEWEGTFRDYIHTNNRLCSLNESLLSNHIGLNIVLFTSDYYLILPRRSKDDVNIDGDSLSSSISGATNYDRDFYSTNSLISGLMREGEEEIGLTNSDYDINSFKVLALTRELRRGGKPEMFYVGNLKVTKNKLLEYFNSRKDNENRSLSFYDFSFFNTSIHSFDKFELYNRFNNSLKELLKSNLSQLSLPALTNILLWVKAKLIQIKST